MKLFGKLNKGYWDPGAHPRDNTGKFQENRMYAARIQEWEGQLKLHDKDIAQQYKEYVKDKRFSTDPVKTEAALRQYQKEGKDFAALLKAAKKNPARYFKQLENRARRMGLHHYGAL